MEITMSPLPPKEAQVEKESLGMDFPSAIREIINGNKVTRLDWEDRRYYGFLNGEYLSLHKPDEKNYQWIVNDGDLLGTDWIVI